MNDIFNSIKRREEEVKDWLTTELSHIQTGRANPGILEGISIDVYGAQTPIPHLGTVSSEDAKTLRVLPWDKSQIGTIQAAIDKASLGVSTTPDDAGLRVIFPELTEETRTNMTKMVKEKLEKAKVSLRQAREETWNDISKKEQSKEITEDEKYIYKDELQKIIDAATKTLEETASKKEQEVLVK